MKLVRPKSLTELVVDELRTRIIDGRLRLGEALSENTLAAELGISKTPVSEALLQLKLERLVDVSPQRGTYVFRLAVERSHGALVARMSEIYSAMRAAFDADDTVAYRTLDGAYHQAMIDLCGNPFIRDAYSQVGFRIQALRSRLSNSHCSSSPSSRLPSISAVFAHRAQYQRSMGRVGRRAELAARASM